MTLLRVFQHLLERFGIDVSGNIKAGQKIARLFLIHLSQIRP
jgi:hypothetical protein